MVLQKIIRIFLCAVLLAHSIAAFETDQYNLPPEPLADIGDEVSQYVEDNLRKAIDKINAEIAEKLKCAKNCEKRLAYLRSEEALAKEVFNLLGAGFIPSTKSGTWMNSHRFKAQPARYKTSYGDSIYRLVPTNYLTISPTVKLFGVQFGTDKIAHLFQQGYTYYKKYKSGSSSGLTETEAIKKAVRAGKFSEQTYFGTLVSGVYSNGDLAANYAGMKFYQGLTHEIKIGEDTQPAILYLKDGVWTIDEKINLRETILKPFISDHFNEALNPSKYIAGLRSNVRGIVRKRGCQGWRRQFPNLTQNDFAEITQGLRLWHGEDYGFSGSDNLITIANTCFDRATRTN